MMRQGARFVCGGVYVKHVMGDVESRHRFGCPGAHLSRKVVGPCGSKKGET
jgi:hypothetical protein